MQTVILIPPAGVVGVPIMPLLDFTFPVPFAAQAPVSPAFLWLLAAAVFVLPFVLGHFIAKQLRMPDYATRIGVVLWSIAATVAIFAANPRIKLGVDLKGGVILVWELADDEEQDRIDRESESAEKKATGSSGKSAGSGVLSAMCQTISQRINPTGTKEIVVRPYGDRQIEVIVPEVDQTEIDMVKAQIGQSGFLEFMIVANSTDHAEQFELARQVASQESEMARRVANITMTGEGGKSVTIGRWVGLGRRTLPGGGLGNFNTYPGRGDLLRDGRTGRIVQVPGFEDPDSGELEAYVKNHNIGDLEVLMVVEPDERLKVTGDHLGLAREDVDERLFPAIHFSMNTEGALRMGTLTGTNLPDRNREFYRHLGIVMDNRLLSAPRIISRISDSGQITGRFDRAEVQFLVEILRSGRLQQRLKKEPISQNQIGELLGGDQIRKGTLAIGGSLIAVLGFVAIYYRVAGLIACVGLLLNLAMTLAAMIAMGAPLTLPGMAGLVLTVGMAVDANILIYERIREELRRGAALRMAIRNGFDRATITIVDSNLTTVLTSVVLYAFGTDQIKGFAVTLTFGLLTSMFTAIYFSRVCFDVAERARWLKRITMIQLLTEPNFDFVGKQGIAMIASTILILVGVVAGAMRGSMLFGIDFSGGTSVTMQLDKPQEDSEVREVLRKALGTVKDERGSAIQYSLSKVGVSDLPAGSLWKVDTSFRKLEQLQPLLAENFKLARHEMTYDPTKIKTLTTPDRESSLSAPDAPRPEARPSKDKSGAFPLPTDDALAFQGDLALLAQAGDDPAAPTVQDPGAGEAAGKGQAGDDDEQKVAPSAALDKLKSPPANPDGTSSAETRARSSCQVEFGHGINARTLRDQIDLIVRELDLPKREIDLANPNWDRESSERFRSWEVTLDTDPATTNKVLGALKTRFETTPTWWSASTFGSKVANDMKVNAVIALVLSLICIVAYVWFRFERVIFGIAAVIALIHDVLVTFAAIAISYWLQGALGFLGVQEFKIGLTVVAAFLTIIGYSLNDTIVIFDRLREVRGKSPHLTADMINSTVNQTLSRTLLTALTVFLVVLILYAFGGDDEIHAFAYAMVVGTVAGTYSTVYIASPIVLWMIGKDERGDDEKKPGKPSPALAASQSR